MKPRMRLLVIDDQPVTKTSIYRCLREGHADELYEFSIEDIVLAGSPDQAKAQIRKGSNFDAVLCDNLLSETGLSGLELFRELKREFPVFVKLTPFIMITAYRGSRFGKGQGWDFVRTIFEEGFSDFLDKPLELSSVVTVIIRAIAE